MKKLDDIQLRNKKRGDTIYYRKEDKYSNTHLSYTERTLYVTSVNDNYIYARGSFDKNTFVYKCKYKFDIEDGYEVTEKGTSGYCYSSKEFYNEMVAFNTKRESMIDCINEMHTKSDMRLVNTMYELMNNWEE